MGRMEDEKTTGQRERKYMRTKGIPMAHNALLLLLIFHTTICVYENIAIEHSLCVQL